MLSVQKLAQMIANGEVDIVITAFPDMYGRLLGKRITGNYFIDSISKNRIHIDKCVFCYDMEMDLVSGYKLTSSDSAYGDLQLIPDLSTLRLASWLDKSAIVLCDVFDNEKNIPINISPRAILRKQLESAARSGYYPKGATELEFYVFSESYEQVRQKNHHTLKPLSFYTEDCQVLQLSKVESLIGRIRKHLQLSGIPVESSSGEGGLGQQEINLRYTNFLEMSDRHVLYKQAAKEITWESNLSITFMSKWDEHHAGSSMHLHISLWNKEDTALFPGNESLGSIYSSHIFRWFLGGWMEHIREIFSFYAPYPTSYKRYSPEGSVPTKIAWSYDNRMVGFRILGKGDSLRIECRFPGSDANPYLAFAATLAAGLDGIKNKTEPPMQSDNYSDDKASLIPLKLTESIQELNTSDWAREVFSDEVVEHYLHFLRNEQNRFDKAVTTWERARYFERG